MALASAAPIFLLSEGERALVGAIMVAIVVVKIVLALRGRKAR